MACAQATQYRQAQAAVAMRVMADGGKQRQAAGRLRNVLGASSWPPLLPAAPVDSGLMWRLGLGGLVLINLVKMIFFFERE